MSAIGQADLPGKGSEAGSTDYDPRAYELLKTIDGPAALRALDRRGLQRLADELAMAFFSKSRPEQTVFKGLSDAQHLSSLEFASRVPTIAGIRTGGDVRLFYELVRDSGAEDDRVYVLRRTELADFIVLRKF